MGHGLVSKYGDITLEIDIEILLANLGKNGLFYTKTSIEVLVLMAIPFQIIPGGKEQGCSPWQHIVLKPICGSGPGTLYLGNISGTDR